MQQKIKITIEYDGTNFAGWQSQKNARSVQDVIESALKKLFGDDIRCYGGGRTDSGVHALGQTAHFIPTKNIPLSNIVSGINSYLPDDVAIISAEDVPKDFDARRSAVQRWYRYYIYNKKTRPVLNRNYITHIPYKLNMNEISKALDLLKGEHDFIAFRSVGCTAKRTILTLEEAGIHQEEDFLIFDFKCRSFLYNMVRIIVGLLIEIGRGKIPKSVILDMFNLKSRTVNIPVASPTGLILMSILYPSDFTKKKIK